MSKIPQDDWYLTPGDTNLNESAHPYTNMHTGTNLPILEAIKKYVQGSMYSINYLFTNSSNRAYELDLSVEARIKQAEKDCILTNHRNTKPERDHANRKRQESRNRLANARKDTEETLDDLEDQIQAASQAQKEAQLRAKELRERKKTLKAVSGVKQKPTGKGSRGKARFGPGAADIADENTAPVDDSSSTPAATSGNFDFENTWDPQPPSPTFDNPAYSSPPKTRGIYSFNFPDTPTAGVRARGNYELGLPDALRLFPPSISTQAQEQELDPSLEPSTSDGPLDIDLLNNFYI